MVLTGCNVFIQFPGIRGRREGVETQNRWTVARDLTAEESWVKPRLRSSDYKTYYSILSSAGLHSLGVTFLNLYFCRDSEIWYLLNPQNDFHEFLCSPPLHTSSYTPGGEVSWSGLLKEMKVIFCQTHIFHFSPGPTEALSLPRAIGVCYQMENIRHSLKLSLAKV